MKPIVFIQINGKQVLGAIVPVYSLKRDSRDPKAFDVKIAAQKDFSFFGEFEGCKFINADSWRSLKNDDQQIEADMASNHLRHDTWAAIARAGSVDNVLFSVKLAA